MAGTDNIILIGMPGAGKSTLGIVLAKILNYRFLDADLLIQQQCDKTLQKLIDACGPDGFIQVENDVLSEIEADRTVIATGGSAVYSDEAMKHLASIGTVVYLKISYEQLVHRLSDLQERGVVLKGGIGMSLRELFDERKPLYEKYAEVTVDVDGEDQDWLFLFKNETHNHPANPPPMRSAPRWRATRSRGAPRRSGVRGWGSPCRRRARA